MMVSIFPWCADTLAATPGALPFCGEPCIAGAGGDFGAPAREGQCTTLQLFFNGYPIAAKRLETSFQHISWRAATN
jgi:hypothetical protein